MLHIIEAPDELAVRTLQGVVRIDMIKPSGIDDTEKEIAEIGRASCRERVSDTV